MDNRSAILSNALSLFAARGYDAVGVQEIADAAGLKKPTLYHYFGNKSGLLHTLLSEEFDAFLADLGEYARYQGDLVMTLQAVAKLYFDYASQNPSFYRMQLGMWFAPPESEPFKLVSAIHETQQQILEKLFIDATADHGNMKGRHRAYAATFLGMLNTYISLRLNNFLVLDSELVYRAVHQFMHGIFS